MFSFETELNRCDWYRHKTRTTNCIGAGLRDYVEHAAAGAAELNAEISGLHGHFFDGIGDVKRLSRTANRDVVVFGSIEQIVVSTYPLAVNGKLGRFTFPRAKASSPWAGSLRAGPRQGDRIQTDQGQVTRFPDKKLPPLNGLSFTRSSAASAVTSSTVSAMPIFEVASMVVVRFASTRTSRETKTLKPG